MEEQWTLNGRYRIDALIGRGGMADVFRGTDLRGASMDEVNWLSFELTGVRLDLVQAVQVARAHGALVAD